MREFLILFLIWSGFQASTQGTQVTDRDYYSKGLKYNSTQIEKTAAVSLGWKLTATQEAGYLQINLLDGSSEAVTGAKGKINLYSRPDVDLLVLPLTEVTGGRYQVKLPAILKGEVTVRVEFERAGARINRQLLLNL